jgi:hypothetical protein
MRYSITILLFLLLGANLSSQVQTDGKVTYITSQHVYVKFSSMENFSEGDTLYIKRGDQDVPALKIENLSSTSCVCIPLINDAFKVTDDVFATLKPKITPDADNISTHNNQEQTEEHQSESPPAASPHPKSLKQDISGRVSVSSYSDIYNPSGFRSQRMRYTFSIRANNLGNSKLSAESYLSFAHSNTNWENIKANIFNGLKIYNLSLKYDFNETTHVSLGRKINPKLSSVGAIDGLQVEKNFGGFTLGGMVGSRPDFEDYGINLDLLQYGIYLGHELKRTQGSMQNTLAFIEQTNHSMTDRRFVYFQHINSLAKNLFLFGSAEVDLYRRVDSTQETIFNLTNTYLSLRYRIITPLTLGLSYSARNNIIYYETYKDFLERLLENETLQGWRFRINYHPARYLFMNAQAGYRFRKNDPRPTKNLNGAVTYSQVPGIGASMTASVTWIETNYLNGIVYGLGISRNIISDKLSGGIKYRYVDYLYTNTEMASIQHVAEANLSWMVYRKLSLSVFYEGTFEQVNPYHRIYINISQRF